jgi:hypothetical protein
MKYEERIVKITPPLSTLERGRGEQPWRKKK